MLRLPVKRFIVDINELAAKKLTPLKKGDPAARIPVYIDGRRVFPPVIDPKGVITYHYEFDEQWKPYTFNYTGHGWMIGTSILLWWSVWFIDQEAMRRTEKPRSK
jgi:hypothetical protein